MERRTWMAASSMALAAALTTGAMLPALADDGDPVTPPVETETWECPLQDGEVAGPQERYRAGGIGVRPEDRDARIAEREAHRAERQELRRERLAAAVDAGELTEEEAEEVLTSRGPHREGSAGPRHGQGMRGGGR